MFLVRLHSVQFFVAVGYDNYYMWSTRSPSGEMVTGGSADRVVRLWDEPSGQVRKGKDYY